jgi:hypothetical protein
MEPVSAIRKGVSWASLTALMLGIGIVGFLTWSAVNKPQSLDNYAKGATHAENTTNIAPVQNNYPLAIPGCGRFLTVETPTGLKYTDLDKKAVKK